MERDTFNFYQEHRIGKVAPHDLHCSETGVMTWTNDNTHAGRYSRAPPYVTPTHFVPVVHPNLDCCRNTCGRRPVQAKLNTAAKSLVVTAALLCLPMIPKFQDRVPRGYRRYATPAVAIALVGAGVINRVSVGTTLGVKPNNKAKDEETHGKELQSEESTGHKEAQLREAFSSSRAEWGDDNMGTEEGTNSHSLERSRWRKQESGHESLKIVSGAELMKTVANIPGYVLREVVIPSTEIGSVLWYDLKMEVLEGVASEKEYFIDEDSNDGEEHMEREEAQMSVEERQVMEIQRNAERAARDMGKATKNVHATMLRLFGRIF